MRKNQFARHKANGNGGKKFIVVRKYKDYSQKHRMTMASQQHIFFILPILDPPNLHNRKANIRICCDIDNKHWRGIIKKLFIQMELAGDGVETGKTHLYCKYYF